MAEEGNTGMYWKWNAFIITLSFHGIRLSANPMTLSAYSRLYAATNGGGTQHCQQSTFSIISHMYVLCSRDCPHGRLVSACWFPNISTVHITSTPIINHTTYPRLVDMCDRLVVRGVGYFRFLRFSHTNTPATDLKGRELLQQSADMNGHRMLVCT